MRRTISAIAAGALGLAACGNGAGAGSSADVRLPDASGDARNTTGASHQLWIDRVLVPIEAGQGLTYGLDLDGDGAIDNAVGSILTALSSATPSTPPTAQDRLDGAISGGTLVLLADVEAASLAATPGATLRGWVGSDEHDIAAASPADASMTGDVTSNDYVGGPGKALVAVSIMDSAPFVLEVVGARATLKFDGTSAGGVIGGGITPHDVDTVMIPAMAAGANAAIAADCPSSTPPSCGCPSGSRGATWVALLDKSPADCHVGADEVRNSDLIRTLLAPDVMIEGQTCLSIGVAVHGTATDFAQP